MIVTDLAELIWFDILVLCCRFFGTDAMLFQLAYVYSAIYMVAKNSNLTSCLFPVVKFSNSKSRFWPRLIKAASRSKRIVHDVDPMPTNNLQVL